MKKLVYLLILYSHSLVAQNVYYDAITLRRHAEPGDPKSKIIAKNDNILELGKVFKKYIPDLADENDEQIEKVISGKINEYYQNNPNPFFEYDQASVQAGSLSPDLKSIFSSNPLTTIGGLKVDTLAAGITDFLIDRAKQELTVAFFNRMKVFFEKTPEIKVLFKATTETLTKTKPHEYPNLLPTLRTNFYEDLRMLFWRTDDVFKLEKYEDFIAEFPEVILSLKTIQVIAEIKDETHPSDVLGDLKNIPEWKEFESNLSPGLHNFHSVQELGYLFSESVRFLKRDTFELKKLENGKVIIQLDSGIAYAKNENVFITKDGSFNSKDEIRKYISDKISKEFDAKKVDWDKTYFTYFLKNLFGEEWTKVDPQKALLETFEEQQLLYWVDSLMEKNKNQISRGRNQNGTVRYFINNTFYSTLRAAKNAVTKKIQDGLDFDKIKRDTSYVSLKFDNIFGKELAKLRKSIMRENVSSVDEIITVVNAFDEFSAKKKYTNIDYIRRYDPDRAWVTRQHLNYLIQDEVTFRIYLGLIYQTTLNEEIDLKRSKIKLSKEWELKNEFEIWPESVLKKGSTIENGSDINGYNVSPAITIASDNIIKKNSKLATSSKLKEGSIIITDLDFHFMLEQKSKDIYLIRDYLVELIELGEDVDGVLKELKNKRKEGEKISKEDQHEYLEVAIRVVEFGGKISQFFNSNSGIDPYVDIARNGNDLYLHIVKEDFSAAIGNLTTILDLIAKEAKKNASGTSVMNDHLDNEIAKVENDPSQSKREKKRAKKPIENQRNFADVIEKTSDMMKYGTAIVNLVKSDSFNIEETLNTMALPVGSYSIKRESRWNFALNAYFGGYYGREKFRDPTPQVIDFKSTYGFWAPIGPAISWSPGKKSSGSFTLFGSIIDVGAIASFRIQNPSMQTTLTDDVSTPEIEAMEVETAMVEELPEITLKNLIAPGLYLGYGIPKWPLTIGFGVQSGPQLRKITLEEEILDTGGTLISKNVLETKEASSWRWQVFLAVDIPLFNFHTKPK